MRQWASVAFSSIYYILRKMQKKGWIRSRVSAGDGQGPARRIFSITDSGERVWREETLKRLADPGSASDGFLLGLAGLPAFPADQCIDALNQYRDALQKRQERLLERVEVEGEEMPLFLEGMFDYSATILDARIMWVEKFLARLEREPDESGQYRLPLPM